MKEAILALKTNKVGLRKAARTFDMRKYSMRRRLRSQEKVTQVIILILSPKQLLGRFENVLSESQEEEFKKYIPDMDIAFYKLTIMDIRMPVFEYYKRNKQIGPLFFHGKFKVNQIYSSKNIFD